MDEAISRTFDKLRRAAGGLPEIVEGTSYGTPALKVGKKMLCRVKDAGTVVMVCSPEDKEMLLAAAPDLYFETDHYKGWPYILIRIEAMPADELHLRLEQAWLRQAPGSLVKAWQARHAL